MSMQLEMCANYWNQCLEGETSMFLVWMMIRLIELLCIYESEWLKTRREKARMRWTSFSTLKISYHLCQDIFKSFWKWEIKPVADFARHVFQMFQATCPFISFRVYINLKNAKRRVLPHLEGEHWYFLNIAPI